MLNVARELWSCSWAPGERCLKKSKHHRVLAALALSFSSFNHLCWPTNCASLLLGWCSVPFWHDLCLFLCFVQVFLDIDFLPHGFMLCGSAAWFHFLLWHLLFSSREHNYSPFSPHMPMLVLKWSCLYFVCCRWFAALCGCLLYLGGCVWQGLVSSPVIYCMMFSCSIALGDCEAFYSASFQEHFLGTYWIGT